ncbi:hypothetical protein K7711_37890 [Nocardia sp. CA2R105]|uniref:hypothetical protein n=1 Tax=Nocardia coffeae TaxID=2873381 RepID=UPI001CA7B38B|nr:hypothetical protein [Nocardia coffeae]MBY8862295.1 hypothetical protein [Nocardia coffeae]
MDLTRPAWLDIALIPTDGNLMAPQPSESFGSNVRELRFRPPRRMYLRRPGMPYRLAVISPSANETIQQVGGWLFDQVMAGWEVDVLVADRANPRALSILGVSVHELKSAELKSALVAIANGGLPHTVAVATQLYASDDGVHDCVLDLLGEGGSEIILWGEDRPVDLDFRIDTGEYALSNAARAFKREALVAAALSTETVEDTGIFRSRVSLKYAVRGAAISH